MCAEELELEAKCKSSLHLQTIQTSGSHCTRRDAIQEIEISFSSCAYRTRRDKRSKCRQKSRRIACSVTRALQHKLQNFSTSFFSASPHTKCKSTNIQHKLLVSQNITVQGGTSDSRRKGRQALSPAASKTGAVARIFELIEFVEKFRKFFPMTTVRTGICGKESFALYIGA